MPNQRKSKEEGNYPLVPMSMVTDEARKIACAWYDGVSEMNDIREKHKLASDIMNYAKQEAIAFLIDTTGDAFKHNAEELYTLFLTTKSRTNAVE